MLDWNSEGKEVEKFQNWMRELVFAINVPHVGCKESFVQGRHDSDYRYIYLYIHICINIVTSLTKICTWKKYCILISSDYHENRNLSIIQNRIYELYSQGHKVFLGLFSFSQIWRELLKFQKKNSLNSRIPMN